MSGTIYQAAAGAMIQQMRLEMISNNLANVNTAGYKEDTPVFRLNTAESLAEEDTPAASLQPYAPPMTARINFSPGPLIQTGNALDIAIVGKGFYEVQTPDGPRYTRNGNFTVNNEGLLSTTEGWPVMGQGGELTIDGSRIEVNDQGDVYVDGEQVGTLRVVDFPDANVLKKAGNSLFASQGNMPGQPLEEGQAHTAQGFVESSNVDAIKTMTEMIETIRVFESYQRIIRTADEATEKTVNEVGRNV